MLVECSCGLLQYTTKDNVLWNSVPTVSGQVYTWPESTYIAEPPFFSGFFDEPAQPADSRSTHLAIFWRLVTTDTSVPPVPVKIPRPPANTCWQMAYPK